MTADARSGRLVFVSHCLLNQNAKVAATASFPGSVRPLIELLLRADVGLVQMPCPELEQYGLGRRAGSDTREQYDQPDYRLRCERLAKQVVGRLVEYLAVGHQVICVLGVEGSPSCSVERVPVLGSDGQRRLQPGSGWFVQSLRTMIDGFGVDVPLIGLPESAEAGDLSLAMERLGRLLEPGQKPPGRPKPESQPGVLAVGFDRDRLWCRRPDWSQEAIRWAELERVEIQTTRQVPIQPDAFWILSGGGRQLIFPMGVEGEAELLARLQQLPGFDDEALVAAVSCVGDERFTCYRASGSSDAGFEPIED
jgi:predicted secreted protein